MNVFRIAGDLSHLASICILIWAIHSNKSAEGVSLITQTLYLTVFSTRYLDLFWTPPSWNWYNWFFKIFYIFSSIYIIFIMTRRYARTREREKAWKLAAYILAFAAGAAPVCSVLYRVSYLSRSTSLMEILWTFSIVLESMCVVPQLLLLRQTQVPTVINSGYLICLGSYRALYILNWIWRSTHSDFPDAISVIFGIIQTALYVDFAWVYYTRQRVKLRGGAIVDSDDLNKGFLVGRFARLRQSEDGDLEAAGDEEQQGRPRNTNWGKRGVSIRADDTLDDQDHIAGRSGAGSGADTQPLTDPDHFLSDDEHDDAPTIDASDLAAK